MLKCVLVIPVFNGQKYLLTTFKELKEFLQKNNIISEIILVDDGSTDDTLALLSGFASNFFVPTKVVRNVSNQGKGMAIKKAMASIEGNPDLLVFTDVEIPYGLESVVESINIITEHPEYQIIVGDRTKGEKQYFWYRKLMSKIFRFFLPRELRTINDTQCGLKVFRLEVAGIIFNKVRTNRWVFDLEIFLGAIRNNFLIYQIPVDIKPSCLGKGGVSFFKHGLRIIIDIVKIRLYDKMGRYKV